MPIGTVKVNKEQELYVIPCGEGFTCLGFDVCLERTAAMARWLCDPYTPHERGSMDAYEDYIYFVEACRMRFEHTKERCPVELTPQLVGLEGRRVEVVDRYDEKRRFIVGKSMGWIPVHIELPNVRSSGGCAVTGAPFKSVRVIR